MNDPGGYDVGALLAAQHRSHQPERHIAAPMSARELLPPSVMQHYRREYFPVATRPVGDRAKFSIPSILAITAALLSLVVSAGWGFFLAIAAIAFGVLGVLLALSPRVRGGMVSIIAMVTGGLGVILALLRLLF